MHEVENVKVVVRLKPQIDKQEENIVQVDGQILKLISPIEIQEYSFPKTPKSNKHGPPKTPKTKIQNKIEKEIDKNSSLTSSINQKIFAFDRIYTENSTQKEIFNDITPFIDSAVEGYNATIFAYGQTGSGKTYTMMGPSQDPGIIPRAVKRIFEIIENKQNSLFVVQVTYVELYLDKFVDLLDPRNAPSKRYRNLPNDKPLNIEIHEDTRNKTVFLTGSETLRTTVTNAQQTLDLINRGVRCRSTGATQMNNNSSRSHAIITFHIESRDNSLPNSPVIVGKLNLVDLAGSERLSKSGVEGIFQKESQNINSSLTALGDVLAALSSKYYNGIIPYRNSKLTRLLQDSLGGNSKTFFIINIQTSSSNYQETLMSLMYGQRAKKIKNITSINKDISGDSDLQQLYTEIEELRQRLIIRTKEFEMIKQQGATTVEENKQLKAKLELLSAINRKEISELESQMKEVIHSHNSELVEMTYKYASLQAGLEEYQKQIRDLKIELVHKEDEKEDLLKKNIEYQQKIELLTYDKKKIEKELFELKEIIKNLEEKNKIFTEEKNNLQNLLNKERENYQNLIQNLQKEHKDSINQLNEKIHSLEKSSYQQKDQDFIISKENNKKSKIIEEEFLSINKPLPQKNQKLKQKIEKIKDEDIILNNKEEIKEHNNHHKEEDIKKRKLFNISNNDINLSLISEDLSKKPMKIQNINNNINNSKKSNSLKSILLKSGNFSIPKLKKKENKENEIIL